MVAREAERANQLFTLLNYTIGYVIVVVVFKASITFKKPERGARLVATLVAMRTTNTKTLFVKLAGLPK